MSTLDGYINKYSRVDLRRDDGILEVTLRGANGESLVWDETAHRELPELFADIARDDANRVIILTGAGEDFCASGDYSSWPERFTMDMWYKIYSEGKRLIETLLSIEVPMIAAINGPARWHAELAVLCDIVLAADTVVLQDAPHVPGAVPGDGVHIVWPLLLGLNRGRYFLLTNQELTADQAQTLGVVNEVLRREDLMPRAWQLARELSSMKTLTLRHTRIALTLELKRAMADNLAFGLLLEGAAASAP